MKESDLRRWHRNLDIILARLSKKPTSLRLMQNVHPALIEKDESRGMRRK